MTKISHPTLSKKRSLQLSCPYNNQARPLDDADERERERERERDVLLLLDFLVSVWMAWFMVLLVWSSD